MSKFYGRIGYVTTEEVRPGVSKESAIEKTYKGDIYRNSHAVQGGANRNNDINVSMIVSIVVDPFAYENYQWIRYVEFMNSKWKVTNIEIEYPRLKLTLGGLYHGDEEAGSS